MPKLPRWKATEAERALLHAGFEHLRSKGSHRIYGKGKSRLLHRSTAARRSIRRSSSRYAKSLTKLADRREPKITPINALAAGLADPLLPPTRMTVIRVA
jgi:hypothetical protein